MALFQDRQDAGKKLGNLLRDYKNPLVLGLPRGGVVTAAEVAKILGAPLDLIFAHKIGHPQQEEFAIGAISERGFIVGDFEGVDLAWLARKKMDLLEKMKQQRKGFLKGRKKPDLKGKTAILVDDGIATGLTMQAAVKEAKAQGAKQVVVAVPMAPKSKADLLKKMAGGFVALCIDRDEEYLGSVGSYYNHFPQVEDSEVEAFLWT